MSIKYEALEDMYREVSVIWMPTRSEVGVHFKCLASEDITIALNDIQAEKLGLALIGRLSKYDKGELCRRLAAEVGLSVEEDK